MNEELTHDQKKEWAQLLYTRHDKTIKEIALTTGCQEAAIRLWAHSGSWDGLKRSLLISRRMQIEQLYELLEKIYERLRDAADPNTKDVDLVIKYTAAIKNLQTETDIPQIVEVAELFLSFLQRKDLELAKQVGLEFDTFIKERLAA